MLWWWLCAALMWSRGACGVWGRVACVDVWKAVVVWRPCVAVWIDVCVGSVLGCLSLPRFSPLVAQIG